MGALKYIKGGLRNLLNSGVSFLSRIDDVSEVSPKAKVYGKTLIYQSLYKNEKKESRPERIFACRWV